MSVALTAAAAGYQPGVTSAAARSYPVEETARAVTRTNSRRLPP